MQHARVSKHPKDQPRVASTKEASRDVQSKSTAQRKVGEPRSSVFELLDASSKTTSASAGHQTQNIKNEPCTPMP